MESGLQSRPPKEALCYPCALRMSMLFHFTPPPGLQQFLESPAYKERGPGPESEPIKDDTYHARFTIVHETPMSVERYLESERPAFLEPNDVGGEKGNNCADGVPGAENTPRHDVSWLCVGCQGLYQFMDLVHAPALSADVRCSQFCDSTAISVNVNVNRSFTFAWLTAATRFFDREGTMTERPRPMAVIPEELSNFKEFYMSDLRARVLQYLTRPHAEVLSSVAAGKSTPGLAAYMHFIEKNTSSGGRDGDEPPAKLTKREGVSSVLVPPPPTPQGFRYSPDSEKLVCEVYCRHHPTEGLLLKQLVPQQYCTNKVGVVLTYSVLYEYAQPFFESIGWASPSDRDTRLERREAATVSCALTHANIYLMGNYRKMMRDLSQSPWFVDGTRVGSFSLQEVIANPILPFFFPEGVVARPRPDLSPAATATAGAPEEGVARTGRKGANPGLISAKEVYGFGCYKFHSAGREDVDVRMLGTGRPFVLEVLNPTREQFDENDLRNMEAVINASYNGCVEVRHIRMTDANVTVRLARHSESKVKRYRCVVWCSRAIVDPTNDTHFRSVNETTELLIEQRTPLRVLHRRSLHTRPRTIHSMKLTPLNTHWFILEVETQAGTYVKEFVHGDMGRTTPNLGSLLNARTDIVQLDVVGMAMQDLDSEPKDPFSA